MRLACLSVDVDSVSSHLEGYGFDRPEDDGAAYRLAIPRALELFADLGVQATFFLIAAEAASHTEVVRRIVEAGHEVGSHSMTHPLPFADLGPEETRRQIVESKQLLEDLAGERIVGFRAPSWDAGDGLLEAVARAGYSYDASSYPSILLPLLRRSIAARSASGRVRTTASAWNGVFATPHPHRVMTDAGAIWEVPVGTTPVARLPYYHTLRYLVPGPVFRGVGRWARMRPGPLSYQMHAADFLSIADGLDERIRRHPGMDRALEDKLALAEECLATLAGSRHVVAVRQVCHPHRSHT